MYAFCVSSFLRFLCCFFNDVTATEQSFILFTILSHISDNILRCFRVQAGTICDVYHRRALGMGVANEK